MQAVEPKFVDAHCHLDHEAFDADVAQVVARARAGGVAKAVNAGRCLAANKKILDLRARFPDFLECVLGLSPHDAPAADLKREIAFFEEHASEVVGVGEIGLDYHYFKTESERSKQREAFDAFLRLAEKHSLPAVVHSREAEEEVLEMLEAREVVAVMHCFMKPEHIKRALRAGRFISVPTLKNAGAVKVIEETPFERLLCETDSPFLARGGGRNEPSEVARVYEDVARIKGVELRRACEKINANAEKVFGINVVESE